LLRLYLAVFHLHSLVIYSTQLLLNGSQKACCTHTCDTSGTSNNGHSN
jgi:hypothetical protein